MELVASPKVLRLLSILVLLSSLPCYSSAAHSAAEEEFNTAFIQCLINTSHSITQSIFTPNNASFPSVLQSYIRNLRFNASTTKKPLLIITALDVSHVQASILCAQEHNMMMKIRSGGHEYEGVSYVTHNHAPFFILDMFNLRSIDIDIETETAWVQAGATLGELYYNIANKSKIHGFPAGVGPNVGVGGHISGRLLDKESMGEDLFWAIRGGGGGSFGVVLAYKIKLVRVPETVTVLKVPRILEENATDIVHKWQYVAPNTDPNLFIRLILEVVNGAENLNKTIRATFIAMFLGDSKSLVSLMDETFPQLGLRERDCIETTWLKSVMFWDYIDISTNPVEILLERTPPYTLRHLKRKSDYVRKPISKAGLVGIWKKMIELETGAMYFNPYGGRMAEIPSDATPMPHSAGNLWKIQYHANW
ncbi:hypothetical protein PIB30_021257 [Stylosanthes scabra]|uniref:FAD-binding PCMH-type domain-containing protein n=1 Tax=Stylosanthes scabra TaxID=79078 RepID=A0ABU6X661_9FABA|nr:hypothetical protein [Stylosanthes scabra]